jgi:methyl-accepting chemotaxis protein
VNTAVNQMDQVTQQNAAMVEEATAAAGNLRSESQELARLVSQFQTGLGGVRNSRPEPAQAGRHLPARNPVAQQRAKVAAAMGGRSAAAPSSGGGWEEF